MVEYFRMPKMTELMAAVTILEWYKLEGQEVKEGEVICQVETEKAVSDIESPSSGILRKIVAPNGSTVNTGDIIAMIGSSDEKLPQIKPTTVNVSQDNIEEPVKKMKVMISPRAKHTADQHGLDISTITGTGPGGKIIERDISAAIKTAKSSQLIPITRVRRSTAEKMITSYRNPHVTITMEVDMTEMVNLRKAIIDEEKSGGIKVSFTDLLVKVCANALKKHPIMNSMWTDEGIKLSNEINIGIAVASDEGLRVPVIIHADKKSLLDIASETKELIERIRKGKITLQELSNGTFTITNLGMFDVETFTPIINPPESAILGLGRIVSKPVVLGDEITKRYMMYLSLSFDHRVIDGTTAAKFLQTLKKMIGHPDLL